MDTSPPQNLSEVLTFEDWGLVDYGAAQERQLETLEQVFTQGTLGTVVFCSHPPIVTLGRQTPETDICGWSGPTYQSTRGGRATYHGPNQIVIYPIINLHHPISLKLGLDVVGFIRFLETLLISTLNEFGVQAASHPESPEVVNHLKTSCLSSQDPAPSVKALETGVWIKNKKIASIGISVKKWITYHGIAINIDHDPQAFVGLNPCGYKPEIMTDLESLVHKKISRDDFKKVFLREVTVPFSLRSAK